jgi:hypothetical protein
MTVLNGSSTDGRGGKGLRSRGHADARASLTVCRLTQYLAAMARPDMPARESLRIAANSSTLDIRGIGGPPSRSADAPTAAGGRNSPTSNPPDRDYLPVALKLSNKPKVSNTRQDRQSRMTP